MSFMARAYKLVIAQAYERGRVRARLGNEPTATMKDERQHAESLNRPHDLG